MIWYLEGPPQISAARLCQPAMTSSRGVNPLPWKLTKCTFGWLRSRCSPLESWSLQGRRASLPSKPRPAARPAGPRASASAELYHDRAYPEETARTHARSGSVAPSGHLARIESQLRPSLPHEQPSPRAPTLAAGILGPLMAAGCSSRGGEVTDSGCSDASGPSARRRSSRYPICSNPCSRRCQGYGSTMRRLFLRTERDEPRARALALRSQHGQRHDDSPGRDPGDLQAREPGLEQRRASQVPRDPGTRVESLGQQGQWTAKARGQLARCRLIGVQPQHGSQTPGEFFGNGTSQFGRGGCVFRTDLGTHSGRTWAPIPDGPGHPFRGPGHPFRGPGHPFRGPGQPSPGPAGCTSASAAERRARR